MKIADHHLQGLPHAIEAREKLGEALFRYMLGQPKDLPAGADDANAAALQQYRLVPRVMRGCQSLNISSQPFKRHWSAPLAVGAFAGDRVFHPQGLLPIARVCQRLQLPLFVSEETVTPLADICAEHDDCWLQLRAAGPVDRLLDLMANAADCGAQGIILTVLAPVHPVHGLQPGGFSIGDELLRRGWKTIGSTAAGVHPLPAFPAWSWQELATVIQHATVKGLSVMVKGVLHPEDAMLAAQSGAQALMVSNIGLRQSARWVTPVESMAQIGPAFTGLLAIDGGIRSGADVLVARCLGAELAVMVRPVIAALAAGGEQAVESLLDGLINEITALCSWCGVSDICELNADYVAIMGASHEQ
ncbi:alpha-hydroxy acid oxidase [Serratia sp. M24T3]|uniref:alpha-hydroxy acid oxidase n=1 Tax=Serratia sp. M24T3 TaxID=932213 RepID=UPI00025B9911|nr:alpha-hydroxy acid oxidase [Serratia sp. M24T3]EIC83807.1 FMN-dependent alpha-hydroxy acid dehydrogenase [Serratia sp. M24T3]